MFKSWIWQLAFHFELLLFVRYESIPFPYLWVNAKTDWALRFGTATGIREGNLNSNQM